MAKILFTTPATRVSAEQLFLIVKFIFSPSRTRFEGTLKGLSDIVFLKANQVNFSK
jgi:hypothetical protein